MLYEVITLWTATSLEGDFRKKVAVLDQWLWSIFFLCIMWLMRASLVSGINMHLSGGMIMALMFGWRLGFLGMCLVIVITCFFNDALFINLGVAIILNALLPVSMSYFVFLLLEAKLPRHFFIYIYGSAFFGTWAVRITSYNVCYTKLLRWRPPFWRRSSSAPLSWRRSSAGVA